MFFRSFAHPSACDTSLPAMTAPPHVLAEIWRWLPIFRSVAELQSMSRAASAHDCSIAAASRAIGHIERALDRKLFERRGRKLILNPHGESLLQAFRNAQDQLIAAVETIATREDSGIVRLSSNSQYATIVLIPTARALRGTLPKVKLSIAHGEPEPSLRAIEERALDFYLGINLRVSEALVVTPLAKLDLSIYVGEGHPLFTGPMPSIDQVLEHGFAAMHQRSLMKQVWPSHLKREITLWVEEHSVAFEACLAGSHLAVVERILGEPYVKKGKLRELPVMKLDPVTLMLCRRADAQRPLLDRVGEEIATNVRLLAKRLASR